MDMQTTNISNQQKYENYREQFKRLNRALASGFNLEAIFIEYAILEDRTESVLRHAEKWEQYLKSRKGREPNIDSKIKYIEKLAENRTDLLNKYFSDDVLEEVIRWKTERNRLIHALLKQQFEHNEICLLATDGKALVDKLHNRVGNYNRAIERRKKEQLQ